MGVALAVAVGAAVLLNSLQRERLSNPVYVEVCQTTDALGKCVPAGEMV